jgi:hypothetical protein
VAGDAFAFRPELIAAGPQLRITTGRADAATTLQEIPSGAALHLLRYDHDDATDAVAPLDCLDISIRVPFEVMSCEAVDPAGAMKVEWDAADGQVGLRLTDVPLYAIVVLYR